MKVVIKIGGAALDVVNGKGESSRPNPLGGWIETTRALFPPVNGL